MGWDDGGYKWDDQANSNSNQVNGDEFNFKYNENTQH